MSGAPQRGCPFCMIVAGQRGADIVLRSGEFSIFRPIGRQSGKVLVVPNGHYESLESMPLSVRDGWLKAAEDAVVHLNAVSYRLQISVGSEHQQVRHIYAQLTYQEGPRCQAAS